MKSLAKILWIALFVVAAGFYSGAAYADPIGPDCDTCQGSIYTLTYSGSPETTLANGHQIWDVTLTIDTSGYTGGGTQLRSVAIKATALDQTGLGAELDSTNASGTWAFQVGGINAGGCDGSGSGFECATTNPGAGTAVPSATKYQWTFDVETLAGGLLTGAGAATIKAQYTDAAGTKVGDLVSEDITLQVVPEPTTLLLAGSALLGIGLWSRKRWFERRLA